MLTDVSPSQLGISLLSIVCGLGHSDIAHWLVGECRVDPCRPDAVR